MTKIGDSLLQRMQADAASTAAVSLDDVRRVVRSARDLEVQIADLEERLGERKKELQALREVKLVEVFSAAGVRNMELEREGNLPPYTAKLKPYYKANISAEWDEERRARGFRALEEEGAGDLIKRTFIVELGKDTQEEAEKLRAALEVIGVDYTERLAVNHQTLTAWFRERVEAKHSLPELGDIGAQHGQFVEVKPVREKSTKRARE